MNMKQKLIYMLIGCLFTLAGYTLSNLANTPTQAQDEKVTVFDKIVCKDLEIVNDEGKTVVRIGYSRGAKSGDMAIYHTDGRRLIGIGSFGGKSGIMDIYNAAGKELVSIGSLSGEGGSMAINNAEGKQVVDIGASIGGSGNMDIYNAAGKALVGIGSEKGCPNDGLINIYNHKGEWRSFSTE